MKEECVKPSVGECVGCVGYAYVPVQQAETVYEPCRALDRGTVFPELDLPIDVYGYVCKQTGGEADGK